MSEPSNIELKVWVRQSKEWPKDDAICAKCGRSLNATHYKTGDDGWYPTTRIPVKNEKSITVENCILLCLKCFNELRKESLDIIPMNELPYFSV